MDTVLRVLAYVGLAVNLATLIFALTWKPRRGKWLFCMALLLTFLNVLLWRVVDLLNWMHVNLTRSTYEVFSVVNMALFQAEGVLLLAFVVVVRKAPGRDEPLAAHHACGDGGDSVDPRLAGIGGWLVLPALGLILSAILGPVVLGLTVVALQQLPSTEYGAYFAVSILVQVGLYVFLLVALARFFGKRRSAPATIIGLIIADLAACLLLIMMAASMDAEELVIGDAKGLIRALIAAGIWIPYFRVSKRVKATFVRDARHAGPEAGVPESDLSVPWAMHNTDDVPGGAWAGAIPRQATPEVPAAPFSATASGDDEASQGPGDSEVALELVDCPHCGVRGVLPMDENRCPNCKRPI
jgi:hypothetical protein